ncbi:MAG: peroxiredoxin [Candidatus Gastranaerophilales bacterium]|nr:peroxiredoxin [Candidatus Gastranaerophilales bacterium]
MHIFEGIKLKGIDENGEEKEFSLAELGEKIVLYFYPKDNTPFCTQEAMDFRDKITKLAGKATIVGVSPDNVDSHKNFRQSNFINFPLLSDSDNKLSKMLGVYKENPVKGTKEIERSTFIIKDGLITNAWKNVNIEGHVDKVIESL